MRRLDYSLLQYAKTTAIAAFVLLFLYLVFRESVNIDEVLEKASIGGIKKSTIDIPKRKEIDEYSLILNKKNIFDFSSGERVTEENLSREKDVLADLSFNGIIILDKKYVAIFSKEDKKQHLVPEGQNIKGIKIKKIKQSSVIISVNNEEKEISF
ncbi:MAG: hypothetical protein P9L98_03340 [Candidatus Kaelpia imicola]|nr:hypothetical protein [Candidatus Kaelpia imicola]